MISKYCSLLYLNNHSSSLSIQETTSSPINSTLKFHNGFRKIKMTNKLKNIINTNTKLNHTINKIMLNPNNRSKIFYWKLNQNLLLKKKKMRRRMVKDLLLRFSCKMILREFCNKLRTKEAKTLNIKSPKRTKRLIWKKFWSRNRIEWSKVRRKEQRDKWVKKSYFL